VIERPRFPAADELRALELSILRALCQPNVTEMARQSFTRELADYRWQLEDHCIVFQAIQRIRNTHTSPIKEQIAAYAARRGFPDMDLEAFLTADAPRQDIESLIRELKATGAIQGNTA
jgi:hypothetical protein